MNPAVEVNFDGLVGPTHSYAGLAYGNVASMEHAHRSSNPKAAALQGLEKMRLLAKLGIPQAILPPHERPALWLLRTLGFRGTDAEILSQAWHQTPEQLIACSSAAAMWTANAATVCPSADSTDGRLHLTPANLVSYFHRSIETSTTARILGSIFGNQQFFALHSPLPSAVQYGDEGAANHTRLSASYGAPGIQLFVYGKRSFGTAAAPMRYPARQTRESCEALVRRHRIDPHRVIYAQQHPEAIDAGIFHNDLISVGNLSLFLYHAQAFAETDRVLESLREKAQYWGNFELNAWRIEPEALSLEEAVSSYFFNSQLVQTPQGTLALIAPENCRHLPNIQVIIDKLLASPKGVQEVHYVDLRQSMQNGGGPACLRLRVVLTQKELAALPQGILFTESLDQTLTEWIHHYYRDQLIAQDLGDPQFLFETRQALDALTQILGVGSLYPFQL